MLKREDTINHCPRYRTPGLFSSNQGKELETRNLLTLLINISLALSVGKTRTEPWMGRIMYKTVLYHQEDAVRAEVLRIEDSGNGAVSVRSTELPKFPGRSDHVGSARSRRRWLLSWFLWDEYNVGWSRWRETCSKKQKWLVLSTLAWESFQDSSGLRPDNVSSAEPCLSHEKAAAASPPFNPQLSPLTTLSVFSSHWMAAIGSCARLPCVQLRYCGLICNQSLNHIDASTPFCLLGTPCF